MGCAGALGLHQIPEICLHVPRQPGRRAQGQEAGGLNSVAFMLWPQFACWSPGGEPCLTRLPEELEWGVWASPVLAVAEQT